MHLHVHPVFLLVLVLGLTRLTCMDLYGEKTAVASMTTTIKDHPWYEQRHHRGSKGFENIWGDTREIPALKAMKWMITHSFNDKVNTPAPVREPAMDTLGTVPGHMRLTWLGHSTVLVQTPELTILTDPMFSKRASPFSFAGPDRKAALPLDPRELLRIDLVLISHDHYDHLDKQSIRLLETEHAPLFVVPLGVGDIVRDIGGRRVAELDWWQYVDIQGLRFHCTPAKHFSGRGLFGRDGTLWASWYIEGLERDLRLFYGGDTGYASHFTEIRERLGAPEVAMLPIGAYEPRWFMEAVHVNPEEAVQAFEDLGAAYFIPVHWGTFDMADEPIQQPAEEVRRYAEEAGITEKLQVLDIGGSFSPTEWQRIPETSEEAGTKTRME